MTFRLDSLGWTRQSKLLKQRSHLLQPELAVLQPEDIESILAFEMERLKSDDPEQALANELAAWHAKWRREALEHYLSLGWSFGLWQKPSSAAVGGESRQLQGYFLGQPLLFFRGMTQSLWIEYMTFISEDIAVQLVDAAYRWSREKHLQKVIFAEAEGIKNILEKWPVQAVQDEMLEVATSKLKSV